MDTYSRSEQVIDGEMDDHQVMINLEKGKYFGLNPVGKRIWEIITTPKSLEEIVDTLTGEYNIGRDTCITEVRHFLDESIRMGIITVQE